MSLHRFEPLLVRQCVQRLDCDGGKSSDVDEWLLRDDRMRPASIGQAGVQLVLEAVTQIPSGTSSKRLTSTRPRSVIFSSGMTESARKLRDMNGDAVVTPIL